MKIIEKEIQYLQTKLEKLRIEQKTSFHSVKEHWNSSYHTDLKDKCEMIYLLAQGKIYNPYSLRQDLIFRRGRLWETTKDYLDFCNIYNEGVGNFIGFISLSGGLFDATKSWHKNMWLNAIKNNKEENSFENFSERLRDEKDFLIKNFNEVSAQSYLVEFEDKKLKTNKFYIYNKENTKL